MSGFAVVLCAPSGTGKTTVARALVEEYEDLMFSVSATTRPPRPGERPGVDYHFVSRDRFETMVEGGEFLEWAEVHGQLYGTPRSNLEEAAERGRDLVLDIDVQGGRQVRAARPDSVMIFLLAPSVDVMLERLRRRGSEAESEVRRRLRTARGELESVDEFEYVVVNDELRDTVAAVRAIVTAERQRRRRNSVRIDELRSRLSRDLGQEIG